MKTFQFDKLPKVVQSYITSLRDQVSMWKEQALKSKPGDGETKVKYVDLTSSQFVDYYLPDYLTYHFDRFTVRLTDDGRLLIAGDWKIGISPQSPNAVEIFLTK